MTFPTDTVLFAVPMHGNAGQEATEYIQRMKLDPNMVKIVKRQKEGSEVVMVCVVAKQPVELAE